MYQLSQYNHDTAWARLKLGYRNCREYGYGLGGLLVGRAGGACSTGESPPGKPSRRDVRSLANKLPVAPATMMGRRNVLAPKGISLLALWTGLGETKSGSLVRNVILHAQGVLKCRTESRSDSKIEIARDIKEILRVYIDSASGRGGGAHSAARSPWKYGQSLFDLPGICRATFLVQLLVLRLTTPPIHAQSTTPTSVRLVGDR